MSADDTARALMQMEDPALRAAVAAGDVAALGGFDLDDHELRVLRLAAGADDDDDDDTSGFGSFAPPYVPVGPGIPLMQAVRYAEDGISDPTLRTQFASFSTKLGAQGTW